MYDDIANTTVNAFVFIPLKTQIVNTTVNAFVFIPLKTANCKYNGNGARYCEKA